MAELRAAALFLRGGEDLVVDAAVVEMLLLRPGPTAEKFVDREGRDLREALRVPGQQRRRARPQLVPGRDLLRLVAPEELEVGLGLLARAFLVDDLVDHGDRVLGQDRRLRIDDLEAVAELRLDQVDLALELSL